MPPRKMATPNDAREAVLDGVKLARDFASLADRDSKIAIYLAVRQGATTREIAARLGVSQAVVSNWRREGEQAHSRICAQLNSPDQDCP